MLHGHNWVGGLVGTNEATIKHSYVTGKVSGGHGLVDWSDSLGVWNFELNPATGILIHQA